MNIGRRRTPMRKHPPALQQSCQAASSLRYLSKIWVFLIVMKQRLQSKAVVFAAVEDGRYVGRVTLRHDWTERPEVDEPSVRIEDEYPGLPQINALEVAEQYRGRGIASQLLAAAENEACQQGFDRVGLAVDVTNKRAMGIYEKRDYMYRLVADKPTLTSIYHRTDGTDEAGEYYLMTKQVRGEG